MKLALVEKLMPVITKNQAFQLMKVLEEVIGNDASASIFRANINPLRLGLQLYKLIDDIASTFGYSQYCS